MFRQVGRQVARAIQQRRAFSTEAAAVPKFEQKWPEYAALMTKEEIEAANVAFQQGKPYVYGKNGFLKPLFADTSVDNFVALRPRLTMEEVAPTLGNGNITQRRLNEAMWTLQNTPEAHGKAFGGAQVANLNIRTMERQNLAYLIPAFVVGFTGAGLYRDLYIEKFNLWDMFLWEARVIQYEAKETRGW
eukprot:UN04691